MENINNINNTKNLLNLNEITVRPVSLQSVYQRNKVTVPLSTNGMDNARVNNLNHHKNLDTIDTIKFQRDFGNQKFKTALDELIDNPLEGKEIAYILQTYPVHSSYRELLPNIVKQTKISKQQLLEIEEGLELNVLTSVAKPNDPNMPLSIERTLISKHVIQMGQGANIFKPTNLKNKLSILALKANDSVANSKQDVNPNIHRFYIMNEAMELSSEIYTIDLENKAIAALVTIQNDEKLINKVGSQIKYGNNFLFNGYYSLDHGKKVLNDLIKVKGRNQKENITNFLKVVDNFKNNKPAFIMGYYAAKAISNSILYYKEGNLYWGSRRNTHPELHKFSNYNEFVKTLIKEFPNYVKDPEAEGYNPDHILVLLLKDLELKKVTL